MLYHPEALYLYQSGPTAFPCVSCISVYTRCFSFVFLQEVVNDLANFYGCGQWLLHKLGKLPCINYLSVPEVRYNVAHMIKGWSHFTIKSLQYFLMFFKKKMLFLC